MSGPKTVTASFGTGPGFTLSALPDMTVAAGGVPASATLSVSPYGGFAQNVAFSNVNPVAGLWVTFSPNPVSADGTTQVTFSATANLAPGTYTATIQGSGGSFQQTRSVNVVVQSASGTPVREYIRMGDRMIAIENGSIQP